MNDITYFETIKCNDYEIFNLSYHSKRISRTIGLNLNLQEYIYPPNNKLLKCKVIYNKYEIISIDYSEYTAKNLNKFKIVYCDTINYTYKFTNRKELNTLNTKENEAEDIIIIKNKLITDTSIANIAILKNNQWITPLKPLLLGTTRDRLLESNFLKESNLTLADLQNADSFAIMNAMVGFKIIKNYRFI
jgi:4-amino-4-deoxychorismate lyase